MPPTAPDIGPGARLRAAREAAKLPRRELADRLGVTYQAIVNLEQDLKEISLDRIYQVSMSIGCDPHSIDARLASIGPGPRRTAR